MVKDTSVGMGIVFSPRTSVRVAIVARKTHSNRYTIAMVQPTVRHTHTHAHTSATSNNLECATQNKFIFLNLIFAQIYKTHEP